MRVAFATCAALPDGFEDDRPAADLLGARFAVWDDPDVEWDSFDRVVIRSTWDYTPKRDAFVAWAHRVGSRLSNPPALIEWNSDKRYLADLGEWGVATVPTVFVGPGDPVPLLEGEVVVKPSVSAGARDTGRFGPSSHHAARDLIGAISASGRTAMVQPYLSGVDSDGERALVFLGGELSHVLHKKPVLRPDEVAPLEDPDDPFSSAAVMHDPELVTPGTASDEQRELAHTVVGRLAERFGTPLYARIDLVPGPSGPVVIEVEAVEPCLYLGTARGASERLAAAVRALSR